MYAQLSELLPNLHLISLSINQRRARPELPWLANCPNALDLSVYPCKPHTGDYLLFLGRMSPDKGCHRAIAVAPVQGVGRGVEPDLGAVEGEGLPRDLGGGDRGGAACLRGARAGAG